jgi:hypothetical protein
LSNFSRSLRKAGAGLANFLAWCLDCFRLQGRRLSWVRRGGGMIFVRRGRRLTGEACLELTTCEKRQQEAVRGNMKMWLIFCSSQGDLAALGCCGWQESSVRVEWNSSCCLLCRVSIHGSSKMLRRAQHRDYMADRQPCPIASFLGELALASYVAVQN